jgi:hypothetical protein
MQRRGEEPDWSNLRTPLQRPKKNPNAQLDYSQIVSQVRFEDQASQTVMSLQYRFTPIGGGGLDNRADVQSRSPLPFNLVNMRDNREESPMSVGILMSAFSKPGNAANPEAVS